MSFTSSLPPVPTQLIHADWSRNPEKRWMSRASLQSNGRYHLYTPQPVGPLDRFLSRLKAGSGTEACTLVGFDFPIGLPEAYARQVAITDFLTALPGFGLEEWRDFYDVAAIEEEIHLKRPFYPARPGGSRRQHLVTRLSMADFNDLRRRCELPRPGRRSASPLFWTMGAQQVGKAAICGWREVLAPGLLDPSLDLAIWPFNGKLSELIHPGRVIIAETYPAEYYTAVLTDPDNAGPAPRFSKRNPQDLQQLAVPLLRWAESHQLELDATLQETIEAGFSAPSGGEDAFDAVVGLFGMLSVVLGYQPAGDPEDEEVRQIEGWILGQPLPS